MPNNDFVQGLLKFLKIKLAEFTGFNWVSWIFPVVFAIVTLLIFRSITRQAREEDDEESNPMCTFISRSLGSDEVLLLTAKLHWINWILPIAFTFLTFIIFKNIALDPYMFLPLMAFIIVNIYLFASLYFIEMGCTNKRIINKAGVIMIKTDELRIEKIESIYIYQTIAGRIFNYGNIRFSGTGTSSLTFKNIKRPWDIKRTIEEHISYYQNMSPIHYSSI